MPNGSKSYKYYGAAGSILLHLAVIVALILITITPPAKDEEDDGGGVLVMIGSIVEETPNSTPQPSITTYTPLTETTEQDIATQDIEESINLDEESKRAEAEKQKRLEEEAKEKSRIDAMISSAFEGGDSNSGATDNTQQGMPNGTSTTGEISVNVGYGSYDLGGRGLKQGETLPKPSYDNSNDEGSIAIRITVNPAGKVIQAQAIPTGSSGTAYQNRTLRERAIKSAYMALFQESKDKSNQQGIITYHFKQR